MLASAVCNREVCHTYQEKETLNSWWLPFRVLPGSPSGINWMWTCFRHHKTVFSGSYAFFIRWVSRQAVTKWDPGFWCSCTNENTKVNLEFTKFSQILFKYNTTDFYVIKLILIVYSIIFPSLGILGKTMYYKNTCVTVFPLVPQLPNMEANKNWDPWNEKEEELIVNFV